MNINHVSYGKLPSLVDPRPMSGYFFSQEESEMKSDGTLSTVKPSQMCAARITVVRG